mmetsp:Transcript_43816/g.103147  ORF Transcript_43816/g.103147 Transcript_43816/m.103147 type:complete len:236 (-) Transcript_43816:227-934(-)
MRLLRQLGCVALGLGHPSNDNWVRILGLLLLSPTKSVEHDEDPQRSSDGAPAAGYSQRRNPFRSARGGVRALLPRGPSRRTAGIRRGVSSTRRRPPSCRSPRPHSRNRCFPTRHCLRPVDGRDGPRGLQLDSDSGHCWTRTQARSTGSPYSAQGPTSQARLAQARAASAEASEVNSSLRRVRIRVSERQEALAQKRPALGRGRRIDRKARELQKNRRSKDAQSVERVDRVVRSQA